MRFASYNVEWMNGLFKDGELILDDTPSAREDTSKREQAYALAEVMKAIDADVYLVLEAPNEQRPGQTVRSLETFSEYFGLRQSDAIMGVGSTTDQEIALLFDPKVASARYEAYEHKDAPAFDDEFKINLPGAQTDEYEFSKPPLEAQIVDLAHDFAFRLIGVHMKSKAPHGASNDKEAQQISFENRRKQIAQATWIRRRTDHMHFPFIVAGDFNDGPGYDEYEAVLGMSAIDVLIQGGKLYDPATDPDVHTIKSTSRFFIREDRSYKEALLDLILVSEEMRPFARSWRIWHPLHDPEIRANQALQKALLTASDHFPVSLDLAFSRPGT